MKGSRLWFHRSGQQFLLTRGRGGRVSDYDSGIPRASTVHDRLGFSVERASRNGGVRATTTLVVKCSGIDDRLCVSIATQNNQQI